jgi:hypothetical protein
MRLFRMTLGLVVGALCVLPAAAAAKTAAPSAAVAHTAQVASLPALKGAPATSLPKAVTDWAKGSFARKSGVDVSQARRLAAPGGGFWVVVPGDGEVCLFIESEGAASCSKAADAAAGRLYVALLPPPISDGKGGVIQPADGRATYLGVAPAHVSTATAKLSSSTADADVNANGLYRLLADNTATSVDLHRDGASSLTVYEPTAPAMATAAKRKERGLSAIAATLDGSYIPYGTTCCRWFDSAGTFGVWRYINEVYAYWGDGVNICVNAQNHDGSWAGTAVCSNYKADHVYNSIYNRRGVVCAQGGGNYTYGLGMEFYDE